MCEFKHHLPGPGGSRRGGKGAGGSCGELPAPPSRLSGAGPKCPQVPQAPAGNQLYALHTLSPLETRRAQPGFATSQEKYLIGGTSPGGSCGEVAQQHLWVPAAAVRQRVPSSPLRLALAASKQERGKCSACSGSFHLSKAGVEELSHRGRGRAPRRRTERRGAGRHGRARTRARVQGRARQWPGPAVA